MYLIDTNVVSELRKEEAGRAHPRVTAWAQAMDRSRMFVAAHTIFELQLGVLLLDQRDHAQAAVLHGWLHDRVLKTFANRICRQILTWPCGARRCMFQRLDRIVMRGLRRRLWYME